MCILPPTTYLPIQDDNKVSTLLKGDHFGAESLQPGPAKVSKVRIEVIEETKCALIMKTSIEEVIGSVARLNKPLPTVSAKLDRTMRLDDLEKHTIVGALRWALMHVSCKAATDLHGYQFLLLSPCFLFPLLRCWLFRQSLASSA